MFLSVSRITIEVCNNCSTGGRCMCDIARGCWQKNNRARGEAKCCIGIETATRVLYYT